MDIKSCPLPNQFYKWFDDFKSNNTDICTYLTNKKSKKEYSLYDSLLILLYDDYLTFTNQKQTLIRNIFFKKLSVDFDQTHKYLDYDYKYHKIKIAPIRRCLILHTDTFCVLQYIADYFSINILLFYITDNECDEIMYYYPTKYNIKNNASYITLFYQNKCFYPMMIQNKNIFKLSDFNIELDNIIDYCISKINLEKIEKNKKTRNKKKNLIKLLSRSKVMELREQAIKYNIEITRYDEKYDKVRYKSKTDLLYDLKNEIMK